MFRVRSHTPRPRRRGGTPLARRDPPSPSLRRTGFGCDAHFNIASSKRGARRAGCVAAFSLVEVIIAVGVFAFAATTVLGLLPVLTRSAGESADALIAQRLPAALEAELRRAAIATGLDSVAVSIPVATTPLGNGAAFVASRDGTRLVPADESGDLIAAGEGWFLIEVWRFPAEPLAFTAGDAALALRARVSWPYWAPGSAAATPASERHQFSFNLGFNR